MDGVAAPEARDGAGLARAEEANLRMGAIERGADMVVNLRGHDKSRAGCTL